MNNANQQELFKAMSNRTRTQPIEIYHKITRNIDQLQAQVDEFNKNQKEMSRWLGETSGKFGRNKILSLKSMTMPKYKNLLIDCQLPINQITKNSKIYKKFSKVNASKELKNESSLMFSRFQGLNKSKSFNKANSISKYQESKAFNHSNMIQTALSDKWTLTHVLPKNRRVTSDYVSLTESVLLEKKPKKNSLPKRLPLKIQDLIKIKQQKLSKEWQKTDKYHNKTSLCLGQQQNRKLVNNLYSKTKIIQLIQKIQGNHPSNSMSRNLTLQSKIDLLT